VNTEAKLSNAVLWAAAIIASAMMKAPSTLTLMILPTLASVSLIYAVARSQKPVCVPQAGAA